MTFLWPHMLWLLLAVPALVAIYIALLRRRKKTAVRFASLGLVKEAMGRGPGWRRHIPPLLFLLALIAIIVSVARPAAVITLPEQRGVVMLAVDVSGSMRATDIEPSRLAAAKEAVRTFVNNQPRHVRIGIVAFAATAALVQPPTNDRTEILQAVDRLQAYPGTAVGEGILTSLSAIFERSDFDIRMELALRQSGNRGPGQMGGGGSGGGGAPLGQLEPDDQQQDRPQVQPAQPGSRKSTVVVLLTDGENTTGPDPVASAQLAADLGVRVFTVGLGTMEGAVIRFLGSSMIVRVDVPALQEIARLTDGAFYQAVTATELREVYQTLSTEVVAEPEKTEITALFSAAAGVLALVSVLLSLLWFNRIG